MRFSVQREEMVVDLGAAREVGRDSKYEEVDSSRLPESYAGCARKAGLKLVEEEILWFEEEKSVLTGKATETS